MAQGFVVDIWRVPRMVRPSRAMNTRDVRRAYKTPFSVVVDDHGPCPKSRVSFSLVAVRSLAMALAWAAVACLRMIFKI